MMQIILITLKGIFRDRIFHGIMAFAVLFLCIPSAASLSMRQVTELSTTLSLSLISFMMLLLAIFLGATSIWKDIEKRYIFSVLSHPVSRSTYILGRFMGVALFMMFTAFILGVLAVMTIKIASLTYPPVRPLLWSAIVATIVFDAFKYILVVAVAMLFSTVSTSFFLPVFGTISIFLAGTITQPVYDYLHTSAALVSISAIVRKSALLLYYLLPNLSGFDLKVHAIYAIPLNIQGLLLTIGYCIVYTGVVLCIGTFLFARREIK